MSPRLVILSDRDMRLWFVRFHRSCGELRSVLLGPSNGLVEQTFFNQGLTQFQVSDKKRMRDLRI